MPPAAMVCDRVLLRPLVATDAQDLYEAVRESHHELGEWLDWCRDDYQRTDAADWIETTLQPEMLKESRTFGVFSREPDALLIGCIGLSKINWNISTANLGYWIRTCKSGQGFATEAAAAVVEYARTRLGLARVEIAVHPLNAKSAQVARALHARDEGVVAARIPYKGSFVDARVFSL